jgi:S1-C subfamily serine protease
MRHAARIWLGILLLGAFVSATAWAELRTWKAAEGGFSTEAEFIELKAGNLVRLRMKDGKERDIPLDRLSAADKDYVAKKTAKTTPSSAKQVPASTKSGHPSGTPNRERIAKLETDTARCETAEEALRLYRIFRDDPKTTDADRYVIDPKIAEFRSLAEKKMVRLKGRWVSAETFKKNRDQANSLMKQGLELLRLKQEDGFRKKFAEAAELEPDNVRAEFLIALIYGVMAHDPVKAKQYYDNCLKRDPENVAVMNNLALTLVRKGDTQTSAMLWRKAAELAPDQRLVQNLGRFLDLAGQKKIPASKGTLEIISNIYGTLISSGKFERADLKRGWLYLLIDEDSMSIADDDSEKKESQDSRPPAAEDGSVVVGGGTGWVVHPNYILTNNHVVDGGTSFDIQLSEGDKNKTLKATLVAVQKSPDLALLKCNELDAPPLTIDPTLLRRGTDIMTLGYPEMFKLGASLKATRGVISAVPATAIDDMYLYDAVVNPGNSGGPVFDNHGNVVAVTTVLYMTAGRYGGGIPSSVALDFVKKHIPGFTTPQPSKEVLDWPVIDQKVSPSTVLIWTRSKTASENKSAPSDGALEDKYCMVCNGIRALKCGAKGCKDGVVTINRQRYKCPGCDGVGLVRCGDCKATGIELALIPDKLPEKPQRNNDAQSNPRSPLNDPNRVPVPAASDPTARTTILDPDLAQFIADANKNNKAQDTDTVESQQVAPKDFVFRHVETDSLLIGFYVFLHQPAKGESYVCNMTPVFTNHETLRSPKRGTIREFARLTYTRAKLGYAVGGLKVKVGQNVEGVAIVYMKIDGTQLDPTDWYQTEYIGGKGEGKEQVLGCDGSLVLGTFGKLAKDTQLRDRDTDLHAIGLITIPVK